MEEDIKILENSIKEVEDNKDIGFFEKEEDLKFYNTVKHLIKAYKELEKENKELLELRISASAHNRIMELEKENQSYRDYYGTPPCYDNSKYIQEENKKKDKMIDLMAEDLQDLAKAINEEYAVEEYLLNKETIKQYYESEGNKNEK